jgi:hypothetical protein
MFSAIWQVLDLTLEPLPPTRHRCPRRSVAGVRVYAGQLRQLRQLRQNAHGACAEFVARGVGRQWREWTVLDRVIRAVPRPPRPGTSCPSAPARAARTRHPAPRKRKRNSADSPSVARTPICVIMVHAVGTVLSRRDTCLIQTRAPGLALTARNQLISSTDHGGTVCAQSAERNAVLAKRRSAKTLWSRRPSAWRKAACLLLKKRRPQVQELSPPAARRHKMAHRTG